ncbi:MAG: hypothetical protein F6K23_21195 [Okeania sp. SIO2C9]|uniref:hypothetical protein n=1 Tax=Okeania sp. SIO2C9 TaxID=2607791 RepID=UPI0013C13E60|nr:hypothetical protein [Okeania sp. SIO2C9]NEQ75342.1 hypothetical protein [Okeania sp. SIO2C9]
MAHITQKGILNKNSNPVTDADVIMTAAIIGHSYKRLINNKPCMYDLEVEINEQGSNI